VIFEERLACAYKTLLADIGVEISLAKSVVPTNREVCGAEFAKRLISKEGYEISPLPTRLLSLRKAGKIAFLNEVMGRN